MTDDEIRPDDASRRRKKKRRRHNKTIIAVLSVLLIISVCSAVVLGLACASVNTKYESYKNSYATQNTEIGNLKTQLAETNNALTDAMAELEKLKTESESLKSQVQELEDKNRELTEKQTQTAANKDNGNSSGQTRTAYLTFDDGVSANTPEILEILAEYGIKATFFVNWKEGLKDYYNDIIEAGHTIGNHSLTHDWDKVYTTVDGFMSEINTLYDKVYEQTGYKITVLRFPGGTNNTISFKYNGNNNDFIPTAIEKITEKGYVYFDWNVDSGDADGKKYTADQIAEHVLSQSKNKTRAVILMHDVKSKHTTVEALPDIIEGLKEMGFTFEALSSSVEPVCFKPAKK